ncbi:hypothetical protein [Desulfocicer niacini]
MIFKKWLPWNFILRLAAKQYNFLDPVTLMARIRQFGQPSEVMEPIELLRAGLVFHARGIINTRAFQYNLDWVWPYWVTRQFNPRDTSFIPRGFSFSHINVTQRNWTALGHPDVPLYPVVDPRGLLTPMYDSWSVDTWILSQSGELMLPSREKSVEQVLNVEQEMDIVTRSRNNGMKLDSRAALAFNKKDKPEVILSATAGIRDEDGWMIIALRPYNPEGIQFIDHITAHDGKERLTVNQIHYVKFETAAEKILLSSYADGDVYFSLDRSQSDGEIECPIGMATAAAFFPIKKDQETTVKIKIPIDGETSPDGEPIHIPEISKRQAHPAAAELEIPEERFSFLFKAARQTVLMLTAGDVYPGPYTYRRFWFRDACFMINSLLGLGLSGRSQKLIAKFPDRQTMTGYFQSQEGEWDSNGQVLWLADRYSRLTNERFSGALLDSFMKGARWIARKRRDKKDGKRHDGLMPAGFSAEHLGPNDYYFWDDFWAVAGLNAAARIAENSSEYDREGDDFTLVAEAFGDQIIQSATDSPGYRSHQAIPASPYRRMDAGAVGSLVADYPLQITAPGDPMVMKTLEYLMDHCFIDNAFFQDMIHSGLNAYLTLDMAQTLLRNNDNRYRDLVLAVSDLASPTGQWPEAIHPITGGGCMGDGQHGWAAAEWIMMMRSLFVREEGDKLIIGSGLFPQWLNNDGKLMFGPTLVPGGRLTVRFEKKRDRLTLYLESGVKQPLTCNVRVPGYKKAVIDTSTAEYELEKV